jgi:hypothetical protein
MFTTAVTTALHLSLSCATPIYSKPSHLMSTKYILMLSTHLRLGPPSGPFPPVLLTNNLYTFFFSPIHTTCRAHTLLPRLYNCNYTWQTVQIMQLLVMQFSPPFRHFNPLRPNILPSILFSNTLCSTFNVRDKVSQLYRTTSKILVTYILIFTFFGSRQQDRGFWMNGSL